MATSTEKTEEQKRFETIYKLREDVLRIHDRYKMPVKDKDGNIDSIGPEYFEIGFLFAEVLKSYPEDSERACRSAIVAAMKLVEQSWTTKANIDYLTHSIEKLTAENVALKQTIADMKKDQKKES